MPLSLDQTEVKTITVSAFHISAFAIDLERSEIIISYNELDENGDPLADKIALVEGPDYPAAIQEASAIAGADVYVALKQALYNQLTAITGKTGTVS